MVHLRRGLRPHARSGKPVLHLFIFIHSEAVPEPVRDPEFTRGPAGHGATVSRQPQLPHCRLLMKARTGQWGTRGPAAFCFLNQNFALRLFFTHSREKWALVFIFFFILDLQVFY
jgi:hypothetical protein